MNFATKGLAIAVWVSALAFSTTCTLVMAQVPPPLAQPNVPLEANGTVYTIAQQADGSIIFGGDFTEVNGVPRSNLARILPDGSLDPVWNPSTNGPIFSLAVNASGVVYVGGLFNEANGEQHICLAKFAGDGVGAVDSAWIPWTEAPVKTVVVGTDGSVYIGGSFHFVNNQPFNRLAKLSGTGEGTLDATWNPSPNASVQTLTVDAAGSLYAGGVFTSIGGQSRSYLAKLSPSGTGDVDADWNPSADSTVVALTLDSKGAIYAGGFFTSVGGQPRSYLAKLSATGAGDADAAWNPSAGDVVNTIALGSDDSIFAGGFFQSMGGVTREHVAKLSATGTGEVDLAWNPSADSRVWALKADAAGNIHVGGAFATIAGQTRRSFARLDASGNAKSAFDATEPGKAFALALQPDGGAIVGGRFFSAGGQLRANILRLRPDGTLDPTWNPSVTSADAFGSEVGALAVDAAGDVYVGGLFESIDGQPRASLAKLSGSGAGTLDPNWNPSTDDFVWTLVLDGKGSVYIGGLFTQAGGQPRNYLAKVSAAGAGAVDPNWDPAPDFNVYNVALDAAGAVYAGGDFFQIGGQSRNFVAKLSPDGVGAADPTWDPSADSTVFSLVPDNQGSVYAGGYFFTIGGESRGGIAKLAVDGAGSADPLWNPSTSPVGAGIYAMVLDGLGSIYVGGVFSEMGGINVDSIAKLSTSESGSADPAWNPGVNGGVNGSEGLQTLSISSNGTLYVGGGFTEIGGQSRHGIAALPTGASPDEIFASGFDGPP